MCIYTSVLPCASTSHSGSQCAKLIDITHYDVDIPMGTGAGLQEGNWRLNPDVLGHEDLNQMIAEYSDLIFHVSHWT